MPMPSPLGLEPSLFPLSPLRHTPSSNKFPAQRDPLLIAFPLCNSIPILILATEGPVGDHAICNTWPISGREGEREHKTGEVYSAMPPFPQRDWEGGRNCGGKREMTTTNCLKFSETSYNN